MNPGDKLSLGAYLEARKKLVDEALERYLPGEENYPPVIFQAVRYSVFAGGKRVRPSWQWPNQESGFIFRPVSRYLLLSA